MEVVSISDDECIEIYKNNILDAFNSDFDHYDLSGYNFDEIPIDIVIYFDNEKDSDENYYFFINCYVYDNQSLINGVLLQRNVTLFTKEFYGSDIENIITSILKFLLYEFRTKFCYSKIIDEIISNDLKKDGERRRMARLKLIENKPLENCCVCFECNIINTKCNHNVCRKCTISIIKRHLDNACCPLCRELL